MQSESAFVQYGAIEDVKVIGSVLVIRHVNFNLFPQFQFACVKYVATGSADIEKCALADRLIGFIAVGAKFVQIIDDPACTL